MDVDPRKERPVLRISLTAPPHQGYLDVQLLDPFGSLVAYSVSIPSVFERARASGALTPGTWTLRIYGYSVPTGSQSVYWAAHVNN